jgi:hypothetical protein
MNFSARGGADAPCDKMMDADLGAAQAAGIRRVFPLIP